MKQLPLVALSLRNRALPRRSGFLKILSKKKHLNFTFSSVVSDFSEENNIVKLDRKMLQRENYSQPFLHTE